MKDLNKLNQLLTEFYDKMSSWEQSVVKETGYSLAQVHTIEGLGSHGHMRMKELAERLGITTGTLTVQIEKLVNAKLVKRHAKEDDKRVVEVSLTAKGQAIYKKHNQLHIDLVKNLSRNISPELEAPLLKALETMNLEF